MTGVHRGTKRGADVGDRYRLTRIAFDVVSVFGCLRARGVPGPVIVNVLAEHGYSTSSVHNQLVRMVHRGILSSEKFGRVSLYRLSERMLSGFLDIAGERSAPEFDGRFYAAVYSIPESARMLRDRFQYVGRMLGYRQLRPGVMLAFVDRGRDMAAQLPDVDGPSWYEFVTLEPGSFEAAQRMTSQAFELEAATSALPALEAELSALSNGGQTPGGGRQDLSLTKFFDLYYEVSRAVMTHPILPAKLVGANQPAVRFRTLMDRCNVEYYLRFNDRVLDIARGSSSFDIIEWLPQD